MHKNKKPHTLATRLRDAQCELEAAINALSEGVRNLPDNHRIRRMPGGANVFIIKSGDLGASWSPEYYDFKIQYKVIHDRLSAHPLDAIEWWNTVRTEGRLNLKGDHTLFLHPDVIRYVDTLLIVGSDEHVERTGKNN